MFSFVFLYTKVTQMKAWKIIYSNSRQKDAVQLSSDPKFSPQGVTHLLQCYAKAWIHEEKSFRCYARQSRTASLTSSYNVQWRPCRASFRGQKIWKLLGLSFLLMQYGRHRNHIAPSFLDFRWYKPSNSPRTDLSRAAPLQRHCAQNRHFDVSGH